MFRKVSLCVLLICLYIASFAQDLTKYQKSADKGDGGAAEYLGYYYLAQGDYETAFSYFEKAADAGMPESMAALATLYNNGKGVEKNEMLAYEWYRKAAAAGSQAGYEGMADCQRTISGDLLESGDTYSKITNPSDRVCFILGYYYAFAGIEDEYPKALTLLKKAAAAGHVYAAAFLGITCYEGNPPYKGADPKAAFEYLHFAYEHGDSLPVELKQRIYQILSTYYDEGLAGIEKNPDLAESLAVMAENMEETESYPFAYEGVMSLYDYIGQYAPAPGTEQTISVTAKPEATQDPECPKKEKKPSSVKFALNLDASPVGLGSVSSEQISGGWIKSNVYNYSASIGLGLKSGVFIGVGGGYENFTPSQQPYYRHSGAAYYNYPIVPVYLDLRWCPAQLRFAPLIGVCAGAAVNEVLGTSLYLGGSLGFNYRFGRWFAMNAGVKASYTDLSGVKMVMLAPVVGISF